jgi:hypothetical protein
MANPRKALSYLEVEFYTPHLHVTTVVQQKSIIKEGHLI